MDEYEIYVPMPGKPGTALSAVRRIRQELIDFFGGLTDTRHKYRGVWKIGPVTYHDDIVIWRVLSDRGKKGEATLRRIGRELEKKLAQKEILITKRKIRRL